MLVRTMAETSDMVWCLWRSRWKLGNTWQRIGYDRINLANLRGKVWKNALPRRPALFFFWCVGWHVGSCRRVMLGELYNRFLPFFWRTGWCVWWCTGVMSQGLCYIMSTCSCFFWRVGRCAGWCVGRRAGRCVELFSTHAPPHQTWDILTMVHNGGSNSRSLDTGSYHHFKTKRFTSTPLLDVHVAERFEQKIKEDANFSAQDLQDCSQLGICKNPRVRWNTNLWVVGLKKKHQKEYLGTSKPNQMHLCLISYDLWSICWIKRYAKSIQKSGNLQFDIVRTTGLWPCYNGKAVCSQHCFFESWKNNLNTSSCLPVEKFWAKIEICGNSTTHSWRTTAAHVLQSQRRRN